MLSRRLLTALAAAVLALPAAAAEDLQEPTLTLPGAAPDLPGANESPKKKKKKKGKKEKAPAEEPALSLPGEGGALPPLELPKPAEKTPPPALALPPVAPPPLPMPAAPLPEPPKQADNKKGYQLGVYKLEHPGQPDDVAFDEIEKVLRSIAEASPSVRSSIFMPRPPKGCELEDDACFAALGSFQQLDRVLLGSLTKAENGMAIRIRLIDVAAGKRVGQAEQLVASTDKVEIRAWAESLACKLLVPNGCAGTMTVDADLPEMQILVDQKPIARSARRPEQITLPVGVHKVRVMVGERTSLEKPVPVLRENWTAVGLYARQSEDGGLRLLAATEATKGSDGKPRVLASQQTKLAPSGGSWIKPTGITMAAVGLVAGGLGVWQGLHGKSLNNTLNAHYAAQGNAYSQADFADMDSAKSATRNGNALLIAGLGLIAAGAVLTFAF
jgi:hypothetical protein